MTALRVENRRWPRNDVARPFNIYAKASSRLGCGVGCVEQLRKGYSCFPLRYLFRHRGNVKNALISHPCFPKGPGFSMMR